MKKFIFLSALVVILIIGIKETFLKKDSFLGITSISFEQLKEIIEDENLLSGIVADKIRFEESNLIYDTFFDEYYITVGNIYDGNFHINKGVDLYWISDEITPNPQKIENNETFQITSYL